MVVFRLTLEGGLGYTVHPFTSAMYPFSSSREREAGMDLTNSSVPGNAPPEVPEPARPPLCPLCGAACVELGGLLRCPRCFFVLCEDCEGGGRQP
jgi:hypothetical protein